MDYNLYGVIAFLLCCLCVQADPCRNNYGGCDKNNGLCWTTGANTHFCTCKAGFKRSETASKHTCVDIDECWEEFPCGGNAICRNSIGSYTCDCLCGYVKDYTGQYCLEASKIRGQCYVPRRCISHFWWWFGSVPFKKVFAIFGFVSDTSVSERFVPSQYENQRGCSCDEGYSASSRESCGFCEDIDECATGAHECKHRYSTCTNTEGSYYCGCTNGYVLGPCGRNCYSPRRVPLLCTTPDLSALSETGSKEDRSFVRPILLENYRTCPESVNAGQNTVQKIDINFDGKTDVTLTWLCASKERGSRSILESFATRAARWGPWTCWTKCKATCWGGLQTRMRKCFDGLPGQQGCEGAGTQKRSCYTGKRCPYRVRKNVESLSASERDDLRQAMIKYKQDMTVKGFHNAASSHGWPFQCLEGSCCPHQARVRFITWHRSIMLNYEEGLVRHMKNKRLGIPYWNWLGSTADLRVPPKFATDRNVVINGRTTENPFYTMEVLIDRSGPNRHIVRDDQRYDGPLTFARRTYADTTVRNNNKASSMHEFSEALETAHNGPHVSTCGGGRGGARCSLSLASLAFAAFDPLFMLHHSQVDRLWAVSQKKMEKEMTWTRQTALEIFEDQGDFGRKFMPFGNTTINAFPIVQATNTMIDSYYYEELTGVKYDDLERDGFPLELAAERALDLRPSAGEVLFVAHYLQSVRENVYVNYYTTFDEVACTSMSEDDFAGQTLILGTDTSYRNAIPRMTHIEAIGGRRIDVDFVVTACYTQQPNCTINCQPFSSEQIRSMPRPGLIYWNANTPVDIFKYYWNVGSNLPTWQINIAAISQYVLIYGPRQANIYQVPTADDWGRCRITNGRRFQCSLTYNGACVLPPGNYYLVDEDDDFCRDGLKMYIVSRN